MGRKFRTTASSATAVSRIVSKYGSIDWLCWRGSISPRFSPRFWIASEAALAISPVGETRIERRYSPNSNVLENPF